MLERILGNCDREMMKIKDFQHEKNPRFLSMKKILFTIIDGLGGLPSNELNGKTELEYAGTPNLDRLAAKGVNGVVDIFHGIAPESDAAVLTLLGYDPKKYYVGRGPFEAIGIGVPFSSGMLALRCNYATSSDGKQLTDRRVGRTLKSNEAAKLADAIQKKVKLTNAEFTFRAGLAHRAVLVIEANKKLSKDITNTDPAYGIKHGIPEALKDYPMEIQKCKPLSRDAKLSAELVNEFSEKAYDVLREHPVNIARRRKGLLEANVIISRDAGNTTPVLPKIGEGWAILADMPLEVGIARIAGMDVVELPLPTMTASDYHLRVRKTVQAMKKYQNLYIHLKGPDLFGHDRDFEGKVKSIEDIDKYFYGPLLKHINFDDYVILVSADHSTPCIVKGHSGDPVPLLIYTSKIGADSVKTFSERGCLKGAIGRIKGLDVLNTVLKYAKD